ncbi:MAG TPA: prolyl oligopeptidase family serine peptidase [Bryobacteraceae bacterium]|nr:prolyl oligopeptidase family serine peptidase [Bryobacteraceae bacterium]
MKWTLSFAALGCSAILIAQQAARPLHLIPPAGIQVSDADQKSLRTGLTRLQGRIEALKGNPRLPDVQIFEKAVRYALEGNEFFQAEEVFRAKELLRMGLERADQLSQGDAPWTRATGPVVRGYISKIDGSVQPYGLVVPPTYSANKPHAWRVDTWFHGRSENLSEVNFLWDRIFNLGQFHPDDTIMLHLYGRYCNGSVFAGEVDLFEALNDVKKNFHVDENRVLVRGFSMGGASAWHIGAHYGTNFAAVAPGAGYAETMEFTGQTRRGIQPTWFEDKLLHLTNATDYATNFFNVPVIAYNGDKDAQRQAADIMEKNMAAEGLTLSRVIGKDIGHAYTPAAMAQINEMLDAIAAKGRDEWPREVRFTTWTLKYNRMRWIVVDGLEKHWDRARVDASIEGDHTIQAKTSNVSAVSFDFGVGSRMLNPASKVTVVLDGQTLTAAGPLSDGAWSAHFHKTGGKWALAADDAGALRKRHDLQGPIDDAFFDSFLMVSPTGTPMNEAVGNWTKSEEAHAIKMWRTQMRGDAQVRKDTDVTDADIAASNLVLWGDPQSNRILARIADKLPIHWTPDSVMLGERKFAAATNAPILIYPNPLNPKKYVVINSGMTMREYSESNNALQVAYLPDYAVVDLTAPPDPRWPGKIAAAGFFDEQWQLQPNDGK